ncbi:hypothetical protein [Marispirochaeta aestuarii]|uniref:hypothetical protein n=1 Tax=Marispirochaeta aestuarii TaxID=1963862 RepID=UPI0029C7ED8B|nr:hypothetical protein [Marispirochaeta aestuarii]
MKKTSSLLLSLLMIFLLPALAFPETKAEQYTTIDRLIIHGLKRTRPEVVERLLEPYIGLPADELDMGEVQTVLRESGLFYETEVSLEYDDPASVSLVVSVQEKWTLIPIPVILGDKNGIAGGGTLIETNAFGLNHQAFLAGFFSADRYTFFGSYMTPPGKKLPLGLYTLAAFSKGETTVTDGEEDELLSYDERALTLMAGLRHDLSQLISLSAGFGYREASVEDSPVASARMLPLSAEISIQKSDWNGVFLSRRYTEIEGAWFIPLKGDSYLALQGECAWEQPLTQRLRLMLGAAAYRAEDAPLVFQRRALCREGWRFFPGISGPTLLRGLPLGLEGVFADFGAGMFSAFVSYQAAFAEDISGDTLFAQGTHFGIRCYLKKIAFPALDLGAAWNAESGIWNAAFSVGMRM